TSTESGGDARPPRLSDTVYRIGGWPTAGAAPTTRATATLEATHQAFTSTGRVRFDGLAGVYALGINALPALGVRRRRHLSRIARDRLLPSGMNRPTGSHGFFMGTAFLRLWEQKTLYYSFS